VIASALTATTVSAVVGWVFNAIWDSKVRQSAKSLQRKYEICDDFSRCVEKCHSVGSGFWSITRDKVSPEIIPDILFAQSQAESKFHQISRIGYTHDSTLIELFELLTGSDFDDEDRDANPRTASEIATKAAEICHQIDTFKTSL